MGEILDSIDVVWHQVWYNRHLNSRIRIEMGQIELVDKESLSKKGHVNRPIRRDVWKMAQKAAARFEKKHGRDNLGPWDDFEWGMLNGKLSSLRWVLGDEWDMLDA